MVQLAVRLPEGQVYKKMICAPFLMPIIYTYIYIHTYTHTVYICTVYYIERESVLLTS